MNNIKGFFTVATLCLCLVVGTSVFAQNRPLRTYTWDDFQFTYPSEWKVILEDDAENVRHIKLLADEEESVSMLISFFEEFAEPDEQYKENPVMSNVSFGLGLALKLAGTYSEKAITLNYRIIELTDGPVLSAVFAIIPPAYDFEEVYLLECFHYLSDKSDKAFFGMILNKGSRGKLINNPKYAQYIQEAYAIARSIVIN